MITKQTQKQLLLLALYITAMALVMYNGWREQNVIRSGGGSPLYRNLTDNPAYIRRGFDPAAINAIPALADGGEWARFDGPPFNIVNSPLHLPKRPFMYPWGWPDEEFTLIIPVEIDGEAVSFLNRNPAVTPGMYFNIIGENWEIYFNGTLVNAQLYLDDAGQITQRRTWWHWYFPLDSSLITRGTNVLALRIVGDPTYMATGLTLSEHYYLDDYQIIKRRQSKYLYLVFIGVSGLAGVYYLMIFLSVRNKREIYYLCFSVFSILLSFVTFSQHSIANEFIPHLIYTPLGYIPPMLEFLALCMFVETIGRGKITKVTWGFLIFNGALILAQIPFPGQFGEDITLFWHIVFPLYLSYIFFYDIVWFYFREKNKNNADASLAYVFISFAFVYAAEVAQIIGIYFFNRYHSFREYAAFIVQIGMTFILAQRFSSMYRQLAQSNVMLEAKVKERTVELEAQTAIAVQANRAKSDFLAVMSHEIRTPLNAVIGLSEIELQHKTYDTGRSNIAQIHQSGSYLLGIINDILDISKIESGNFEIIPAVYETPSFIGDTIALNRVRLGSKPIHFALEIAPDFPCKLKGDELRVKQILNNLLSNAVKYTHEGTITLAINKEERKMKNEEIVICFTVRDTGIGIRAEDMGKLFTNYTQLDAGANRKTEGTGLGLSITKKLVEMMGGSIWAESEYGKGSVFTVEIMQELEDADGVIGEETAHALRNFSYITGGTKEAIVYTVMSGKNALVVDDLQENLLVLKGLLSPYGLRVDTALSGSEAIEMAQRQHYDLIFMDHMMPAMDGVATTENLRQLDGFNTPVVALTANALRGMREFYLEHGFDDYLSKPIDAKALDEVIKKWMNTNEEGAKSKEQRSANNFSFLPFNFSLETEFQLLDRLNHFRVSFENAREFDSAYFEKFATLIESFNAAPPLKEQADLLQQAAQGEDIPTIRATLPAFCAALDAALRQQPPADGNRKTLDEVLYRLKKALRSGEAQTAAAILAEIATAKLDDAERRLYFLLYGLLYEGNAEKALDAIYFWEKLQ